MKNIYFLGNIFFHAENCFNFDYRLTTNFTWEIIDKNRINFSE